jgi:hypothetical protein
MSQKIEKDKYGPETWDTANIGRVYVHIINSEMYYQITGKYPPSTPIDAKTYSSYNYPWYDYYNENQGVEKSNVLSNVKNIKQIDDSKYAWPIDDNSETIKINKNQVKQINEKNVVNDGNW